MQYNLAIYRAGSLVGYIACADDRDILTTVKRHARRFSYKGVQEYLSLLEDGRTRYKLSPEDCVTQEFATSLLD